MYLTDFIPTIYSHEPRKVHEMLGESYKGEKTKCSFLVHAFCSALIDCNVWVVKNVHDIVCRIEKEDVNKKNIELNISFINLLRHMKPNKYNIDFEDVNKSEVEQLMYFYNKTDISPLESHREVLREKIYDMLSAFCVYIKDKRVEDVITILKYVLCAKYNEVFTAPGYDIVLIIFNLIFNIVKNPDAQDYIGCARDLFYYKLKHKCRKERLPVLLTSVLVAINRSPKNKAFSLSIKDERLAYLYVFTEVDLELEEEVINSKKRILRKKPQVRSFNVESKDYDKIEKLRQSLSIIKSQ